METENTAIGVNGEEIVVETTVEDSPEEVTPTQIGELEELAEVVTETGTDEAPADAQPEEEIAE